ncbi:hypothetical protein MMC28_007744 [Mycoblastus sanguinarius]|nr:hypothetical protein [Mycoblastus sanguinarius]
MKRLLPQLPSLSSIYLPCRQRLFRLWPCRPSQNRLLTTAPQNLADDIGSIAPSPPSPLSSLDALARNNTSQPAAYQKPVSLFPGKTNRGPHKLHIYATKHNTHITLATGTRQPLISVSAGNLNFKKAQRGTYDAAYQLGAYVMGRIKAEAMLNEDYAGKGGPIKGVEVVLRDFGPGREAVTKILLGSEGKLLRGRILRVMDGTRLKFGGTRSKKPRRLG